MSISIVSNKAAMIAARASSADGTAMLIDGGHHLRNQRFVVVVGSANRIFFKEHRSPLNKRVSRRNLRFASSY